MNSNRSQKGKNQLSSKDIAFGGIYLTFSLLFVFLAGTVSNIQMVSYCFSSLLLLLILNQSNFTSGIVFYVASSLLCLLILPNKLAVIPYILFFGHYGLWFYLYQTHKKKAWYYVLHLLINNLCIAILYVTFHDLFINLKITKTVVFIPAAEVFLVLYHYMYGKCNRYIQTFLRRLS